MKITDRYSSKKYGPIRVGRHGLFGITSVSMSLPFKKKWIIYKRGSGK